MSTATVTARDHRDAAAIAVEAGRLLVELRLGIGARFSSKEGMDLGDAQANELILRRLAELHPDDPVLSEESPSDPAQRVNSSRVWIVDPLDGTREFGEPPRTDWAVHVALAVDGEPVVGAVALPARDEVLTTAAPPTAPPSPSAQPRITVSRSRPPAWAPELADALGGVLTPIGSAGAKMSAVIQGAADIYVHAGGQHEWDSAAPVAVALATGLHCSRIDGSPLRYNCADPWLPDLAVCHPSLAAQLLAALARLLPSPGG